MSCVVCGRSPPLPGGVPAPSGRLGCGRQGGGRLQGAAAALPSPPLQLQRGRRLGTAESAGRRLSWRRREGGETLPHPPPPPPQLPTQADFAFLPRSVVDAFREKQHLTLRAHYFLQSTHDQPSALYRLGQSHAVAPSVLRDDATAVSYLTQAASKGAPRAMHLLALWHQSGERGLAKDVARATDLFLRAAALGHDYSAHVVALILDTNAQLRRYIRHALIPQYRVEGKRGNLMAQAVLGYLVLLEEGAEAAQAVLDGQPELSDSLGCWIGRWTETREKGGGEAARQRLETAALAGNVFAMERLAVMYGELQDEDSRALAAAWYEMAAEQGSVMAQAEASMVWRKGSVCDVDIARAELLLSLHLAAAMLDRAGDSSASRTAALWTRDAFFFEARHEESAALHMHFVDACLQVGKQPNSQDLVELAWLYHRGVLPAMGQDDSLALRLCALAVAGKEDPAVTDAAYGYYTMAVILHKGMQGRRSSADAALIREVLQVAVKKYSLRIAEDNHNVDLFAHYRLGMIAKAGFVSGARLRSWGVSSDPAVHFRRAAAVETSCAFDAHHVQLAAQELVQLTAVQWPP